MISAIEKFTFKIGNSGGVENVPWFIKKEIFFKN